MRTPRGGVATPKCYQHFGLEPAPDAAAGMTTDQGRLPLG